MAGTLLQQDLRELATRSNERAFDAIIVGGGSSGLTVARTLFQEPCLSTSDTHEGLLLHSIYHRPNGWDYIPPGSRIPKGESSQWGDYHERELALLILRMGEGKDLRFYL